MFCIFCSSFELFDICLEAKMKISSHLLKEQHFFADKTCRCIIIIIIIIIIIAVIVVIIIITAAII